MLYEDLMQSASKEFSWLIGGFDAGDGKRGYFSAFNLQGHYNFNISEEVLIYRIDGKKLIIISILVMISESNSILLCLVIEF